MSLFKRNGPSSVLEQPGAERLETRVERLEVGRLPVGRAQDARGQGRSLDLQPAARGSKGNEDVALIELARVRVTNPADCNRFSNGVSVAESR